MAPESGPKPECKERQGMTGAETERRGGMGWDGVAEQETRQGVKRPKNAPSEVKPQPPTKNKARERDSPKKQKTQTRSDRSVPARVRSVQQNPRRSQASGIRTRPNRAEQNRVGRPPDGPRLYDSIKSTFTCRWNDSSSEMVVSVVAMPWMRRMPSKIVCMRCSLSTQ